LTFFGINIRKSLQVSRYPLSFSTAPVEKRLQRPPLVKKENRAQKL
jgi:hypothetical protein